MALTPDTDQFSQFLRLAFLRSPNFLTGVSGWTINQDGSAEFNNITIRNGEIISGVFLLYSGNPPAKGNLVLAFAPITGGTDSVGNVYPQGFNFGVWSASTGALLNHFGIDVFGNTYLANSSGLTVVQGASGDGSMRFYNSSGQALGNLVTSIAPTTGTDGVGNKYIAGDTVYNNAAGVAMQLFSNGIFAYTGSLAGGWTAGQAALSSSGNNWVITAGTGGSAAGSVIVASISDGNSYLITRLDIALAVSFSINSASPLTIFSVQLGVGTYEIDIWGVTLNATAADAAQFAFAFTGTATAALVDYETISGTGPAVVNYTASATLTTVFNGQGVAGNQRLIVHLGVTVSVAGTLTFTGKELVAGNTISVFAGSRMRVCPV